MILNQNSSRRDYLDEHSKNMDEDGLFRYQGQSHRERALRTRGESFGTELSDHQVFLFFSNIPLISLPCISNYS